MSHPNARLTPLARAELVAEVDAGWPQAEVARRFRVSRATVAAPASPSAIDTEADVRPPWLEWASSMMMPNRRTRCSLPIASRMNGNFCTVSGLYPLKGGADIPNPWLDEWPPVRAENDQCQVSAAQVLLIGHVLICGNHDFIPCFLSPVQQRAIDKRCPPAFLRHVDVMTGR